MMANRKAKKLCVDDIRRFLEREHESESDFSLIESEFELDSNSSGAYESFLFKIDWYLASSLHYFLMYTLA